MRVPFTGSIVHPVSRQILQLVDRQLFFEGVLHLYLKEFYLRKLCVLQKPLT